MDTAAVQALLDQHADLERRLADPALHADQHAARKAGRRYGELSRIVRVVRELEQARSDVAAG
ncbi:MAG: PCRF domain-containing protein, partial [Actinomycetota bacterium]|nr:PCRF domain-containing protein [Actinomycetota bacterium]